MKSHLVIPKINLIVWPNNKLLIDSMGLFNIIRLILLFRKIHTGNIYKHTQIFFFVFKNSIILNFSESELWIQIKSDTK